MKIFNQITFIERAKKIHKNKYDYSLIKAVKNNTEKIIIICPIHGEFKQRISHHISGCGCKKCAGIKVGFQLSRWPDNEIEFLKKEFGKISVRKLSLLLNKSQQTIRRKAKELGLKSDINIQLHEHIPNYFWTSLKNGAENRGLEIKITLCDIWNKYIKQKGKCALTGKEIFFSKRRGETTASVDRIDSSKEYLLDNIQIVHKDLNKFKWDWEEKILYKMSRDFINYRKDLIPEKQIIWEDDVWNDTLRPILVEI